MKGALAGIKHDVPIDLRKYLFPELFNTPQFKIPVILLLPVIVRIPNQIIPRVESIPNRVPIGIRVNQTTAFDDMPVGAPVWPDRSPKPRYRPLADSSGCRRAKRRPHVVPAR
jgi:hypothetical protein